MPWLAPNETDSVPRYGLFLQLDGAPDGATVYQHSLELIVAGEALGAYSARVTQHHFGERYGWLPAPLPFLAAAGQLARKIRLGTVVLTLPLEQAVRVAEEAAVTDHLLEGRLELGFGSGLNQAVFATLGANFESRRETTRHRLEQIQAALQGAALDEPGTHLQPPAPTLVDRLWFAAMSEEGACYAARRNLGLLLGRVEHGAGSPVVNQSRTTAAYREALQFLGTGQPRIAVGRTIYPAPDQATAKRDLNERATWLILQQLKIKVPRKLKTAFFWIRRYSGILSPLSGKLWQTILQLALKPVWKRCGLDLRRCWLTKAGFPTILPPLICKAVWEVGLERGYYFGRATIRYPCLAWLCLPVRKPRYMTI